MALASSTHDFASLCKMASSPRGFSSRLSPGRAPRHSTSGSAGYDVSGSGCQTTSSTSEPQFTLGDQQDTIFLAQDARPRPVLQIFNPFVSTSTIITPPYYSLTTYHLRQIYGDLHRLRTRMNKLELLQYSCTGTSTRRLL